MECFLSISSVPWTRDLFQFARRLESVIPLAADDRVCSIDMSFTTAFCDGLRESMWYDVERQRVSVTLYGGCTGPGLRISARYSALYGPSGYGVRSGIVWIGVAIVTWGSGWPDSTLFFQTLLAWCT